jgi:tRNA-binding protein
VEIAYEQFAGVDMRVGRIVRAEPFPEARKPSYRLWIDFGELGEKQSSAQLTTRYQPEELVGRQVIAVVNLGVRRVAGFRSEVLVLGAIDDTGDVALLSADEPVVPGQRVA